MSSERAHLSIGEVLSLVQEEFPDVTISKIRFLESQGLLDPERTPSGYRKFYRDDIDRLQWILTQQRDHFLPLKVIRERLDEWDATGRRPGSDAPAPEAELDTRHAAASLAAASAVEVVERPPSRPAEPEPEPAPLVEEPAAAPAEDGPEFRVGPSSTSLTAQELAEEAGVEPAVVAELESYSMIEARHIGGEAWFEPSAIGVVDACRRFLDHGVEVRHLRMYKIAAEREAGMFEQLVMPLLKQRNPVARQRAVDMVGSLSEAGEALHAALLRNALSDTLP